MHPTQDLSHLSQWLKQRFSRNFWEHAQHANSRAANGRGTGTVACGIGAAGFRNVSEERLPVKRLDPKNARTLVDIQHPQQIPKSDTVGHPTSKQNKCIQMCHAGNLWQLAWREDAMCRDCFLEKVRFKLQCARGSQWGNDIERGGQFVQECETAHHVCINIKWVRPATSGRRMAGLWRVVPQTKLHRDFGTAKI